MPISIIDAEVISSKKSPAKKSKPVRVDGPIIPFEFHDQMTPAHVINKLRDGKLSTTDLLLLYVIGPYTKHLEDGTGRGCYASNEYLGKAAKVHATYAGERLNHMAKSNLLLIFYVDGKRYIETEWGRTADERANLKGAYGKALNRAYNELQERAGNNVQPNSSRKTLTPLKENLDPPQGKPLQIEEEDNKAKDISPASPSANGGSSGHFPFNGDIPRTKARMLADQLRDGLSAKRMIRNHKYNHVRWEKAFASLLSEYDYDGIAKSIRIHVNNVHDEFWPNLLSADSFCDEYPRLLKRIRQLKASRQKEGMQDGAPIAKPLVRREVLPNGKIRVTDLREDEK